MSNPSRKSADTAAAAAQALPGPEAAGDAPQEQAQELAFAPTLPTAAEAQLMAAKRQAEVNLDTAPTTYAEADPADLVATGGYFPGGGAPESIPGFELADQPRTFAETVGAIAPELRAEAEQRQAAGMAERLQQVMEIPRQQVEAMSQDVAASRLDLSQVPISAGGEISKTRARLAAQSRHIIWLFPNIDETGFPQPREFSINLLQFVLPTGKHLKDVPRDVVERCVASGWCQCPPELVGEFTEKNIIPQGPSAPRSALAMLVPGLQPSGLYLGDNRGAQFAQLANR
jgi:hypothetical protein